MSTIIEYETEKWRQLQSNFTKFLSLLEKNKNEPQGDLFLLKMLKLNDLVDQLEIHLDEIKYECIYNNSNYANHKKIKSELKQYFLEKTQIKSLLNNLPFNNF